MAALVRSDYNVLVPYGDSCRYDAIIESADGTLARVQVKTGRLGKGVIEFRGYSSHSHRGATMRTYVCQVEFFGVYCPQVGQCFLVPAEGVVTHGSLRVEPTRNRQGKGAKWAADFTIDKAVVGVNGPSVVPSSGKLPL
jgi:PD-(D/E)XK endonuclease